MTRLELLQLRDFINGRLMCGPDESDRACYNRTKDEVIAKLDAAIVGSAPEARANTTDATEATMTTAGREHK